MEIHCFAILIVECIIIVWLSFPPEGTATSVFRQNKTVVHNLQKMGHWDAFFQNHNANPLSKDADCTCYWWNANTPYNNWIAKHHNDKNANTPKICSASHDIIPISPTHTDRRTDLIHHDVVECVLHRCSHNLAGGCDTARETPVLPWGGGAGPTQHSPSHFTILHSIFILTKWICTDSPPSYMTFLDIFTCISST